MAQKIIQMKELVSKNPDNYDDLIPAQCQNATNATNATKLIDGGTIASNVTATTQANTDNSKKVATTEFVHNLLGFNQGNITYGGDVVGTIYRQAHTVYGTITNLPAVPNSGTSGQITLQISDSLFYPTTQVTALNLPQQGGGYVWCTINTNGNIVIGNTLISQGFISGGTFYFGYQVE